LCAYAIGSARGVDEEYVKGTLSRGLLADLAVLGGDLFGVVPEHIGELTVGAAVAGGGRP
jgi:predicted amidohydrolase YtcJ